MGPEYVIEHRGQHVLLRLLEGGEGPVAGPEEAPDPENNILLLFSSKEANAYEHNENGYFENHEYD